MESDPANASLQRSAPSQATLLDPAPAAALSPPSGPYFPADSSRPPSRHPPRNLPARHQPDPGAVRISGEEEHEPVAGLGQTRAFVIHVELERAQWAEVRRDPDTTVRLLSHLDGVLHQVDVATLPAGDMTERNLVHLRRPELLEVPAMKINDVR